MAGPTHSTVAPEPPPAGPVELGAIPETLAEGAVNSRKRYSTTWNWKHLRQFLWASPELAFAGADPDEVVEFGPLSLIALRNGEAALVRLVPRFPGHSDFELVRIGAPDAPASDTNGADPIEEALRHRGDRVAAAPSAGFDRAFYDWYWSLLAPAEAQ
jgi:hypothetical protein